MKKCLKFAFFGLVLTSLYITSCSDGAIGDDFADELYVPKGVLISAQNADPGFFNAADISGSTLAFDLVADGVAQVNNVDVFMQYNGGAPIAFTSVSSVPASLNVSFTDVLSAANVAEADVEVGDEVLFSFEATTPDGVVKSSSFLRASVSCPSDLGGTHPYVSTNLVASNSATACPTGEVVGEVTFTDLGGGVYQVSDLGFGQYESSCWSDGPATSSSATFQELCYEVISGGLDQYGLTYTWVVTGVSGSELSISWSNDYADSGDVVITKADGTDWPPLFTN